MQKEALGVDIGGVLIDRINDNTDTSFFSENYLKTTAVPEAFETLRALVEKRFGERVYLVSKCGRNTQRKTLEWLEHHRFHERTGVSPGNVEFCVKREEKAPICQRLGVTHFIDDRLEVLGYLTSVSNLYLFQPDGKEVRRHLNLLKKVKWMDSWAQVRKELLNE